MIDTSGNIIKKEVKTYKKYTYKEVEKEIFENYFDKNERHSSALDILATYLRGQKLIYMESKAICEKKLNQGSCDYENCTKPDNIPAGLRSTYDTIIFNAEMQIVEVLERNWNDIQDYKNSRPFLFFD